MKRIAFAAVGFLAVTAPAAWADCHLPLTRSLPADKMARPVPCLAPLQDFVNKAHTGTGAAASLSALWVDDAQAELQDPLGAVYRGRTGIKGAFEGSVFTSLLAGAYRVIDGSISHGHLKAGAAGEVDEAGILEWDATIDGAPGGGKHHVRALVVRDDQKRWAFHSVHVTADLTR
jgi:hypothetical protein